ncbi:N-acetylglucosamine-6-phosphate deacetylase [Kurthia sibirica]|uniref:N-acetylglucosamine-6-phosphate deacetylase n=1 Tax=Kurthia sibirica TaxID=202750 RepID=A0A2U3AII8_9BACL|nr:N-acetylglucosamine-6-phosphate deacetylase [Kurthia sibirica]PWI24363.1 N-acetylglucosamine-6-phosphate deacetylase [Kurthia sibirica]GEK33361.1 N-acetylglucosamine-6-phosphate deacetylase [Kurthia sibirica]
MANSIKIHNITIINARNRLLNHDVMVQDGKITAIAPTIHQQADRVIDGTNQLLFPGFIDMHIHGSAGVDVMDATQEALHKMSKSLVKEGVTSFLATTMTQKIEAIEATLETIANFENNEDEAQLVGVHVEGPFISKNRAGAQPLDYIIAPTGELLSRWQQLSGHLLKEITVAPEVENGFEFVKMAADAGIVVSIGHSDATFEEVEKAVILGASQGTHLYNQMRPFHHREPGVVGASLVLDDIKTEMIVDFIHSHEKSVALAFKCKGPENIILITDAMRAKGVPFGDYDLGGQMVHVTQSGAHLPNGALAGSVLTMDLAVRNMQKATGCTLENLVAMSSTNAANQLKMSSKGRIETNADADMLILSQDLTIQMTIKKGKVIYSNE